MAALTPFRTALIHPPVSAAATVTGTIAVTLGAVTMSASGSVGVGGTIVATLAPVTMVATGTASGVSVGSPGWPQAGGINSGGGTAFGGNIVHIVKRVPRRIGRPTRVR